jgi:ubiquitin C-terminal hydrolase
LTLEECMQHYYAPEHLKGDNKYMCSGCKKKNEARKRFSIETSPRTLIINFKRFTNFGSKLGEFVRYP